MANGTFTENGSTLLEAVGGASRNKSGFNTLYASGSWGTGSLRIQASPNGTDWFNLTDVVLTANGSVNFQAHAKNFRITLSGATGGEDIDWWVN